MEILESRKYLIEFTGEELQQIQISATQQMINIAASPASDLQIERLGQVVTKCAQVAMHPK